MAVLPGPLAGGVGAPAGVGGRGHRNRRAQEGEGGARGAGEETGDRPQLDAEAGPAQLGMSLQGRTALSRPNRAPPRRNGCVAARGSSPYARFHRPGHHAPGLPSVPPCFSRLLPVSPVPSRLLPPPSRTGGTPYGGASHRLGHRPLPPRQPPPSPPPLPPPRPWTRSISAIARSPPPLPPPTAISSLSLPDSQVPTAARPRLTGPGRYGKLGSRPKVRFAGPLGNAGRSQHRWGWPGPGRRCTSGFRAVCRRHGSPRTGAP